jgi:hypothetical protein
LSAYAASLNHRVPKLLDDGLEASLDGGAQRQELVQKVLASHRNAKFANSVWVGLGAPHHSGDDLLLIEREERKSAQGDYG